MICRLYFSKAVKGFKQGRKEGFRAGGVLCTVRKGHGQLRTPAGHDAVL